MVGMIGRALDAARTALRDLDADQVPASLRRVVAHSGALTPPLADRLARELDSLDWLRRLALEAWPQADPAAPGPDRASALYLARPEGWVAAMAGEIEESVRSAVATREETAERERQGLRRDLEISREREKDLRRRLEAAEAKAHDLRRRVSAPVRAERADEARAREDLARERSKWEAARSELESTADSLDEEVSILREELRRARSARAEMGGQLEAMRGGSRWAERDPIALGAFLDDVAAQARPARTTGEEPGAGAGVFELSPGVRPDEARAVDDVLAHPGPLLVVVDGYNVALSMWSAPRAETRDRLEALLRRLVVVGSPAHRVCVVWDSSFAEGSVTRNRRLEVRFADGDMTADDVVVGLARGSSIPVVIVTNDRELRDRSKAVGAYSLWADALVAWASRRS